MTLQKHLRYLSVAMRPSGHSVTEEKPELSHRIRGLFEEALQDHEAWDRAHEASTHLLSVVRGLHPEAAHFLDSAGGLISENA